MTRIVFSLFCFLAVLPFGHAQKKKAWVEAADRAFQVEEDFYKAFKYYEAALMYTRDTSDVLRLLYQKGQSARMFNAYLDAREAYQQLISRAPADSLLNGPYGCVWAYLGDLHMSLAYSALGNMDPAHYDQAAEYFQTYNNHFPNAGGECAEMARRGLEVIRFVQDGAGRGLTNDSLTIKNAGPHINSRFSDFAAMPWGDRLYFTSYRNEVRQKGVKPNRYFSRIYLSENSGPADTLAGINLTPTDTLHVGHTAFNRNRDRIYFTLCEFVDRKLNTRCDLYYHVLDSGGNPVGDAIEVSELNMAGFTLTQPALSWDDKNEREILYFVSDRPGGSGKMDIWKSELTNGSFSDPVNLAGINTPGDEMSPFEREKVFYFSSNNREERYGGFDIYRTNDPANDPPVNLGQKINSSTDELYFSLNESGTQAYFSSNRLASTTYELSEDPGDDRLKEACCLDIYTYQIPPPPPCGLLVECLQDMTNYASPVATTVELYDITAGDQGSLLGTANGIPFEFSSNLLQGRKYLVKGTASGFSPKTETLDFTQGQVPCSDGSPERVEFCPGCAAPSISVEVLFESFPVTDVKLRMIELTQTGSLDLSGLEDAPERPLNRGTIPCPANIDLIGTEKLIQPSTAIPVEYDRTYAIIADSHRDSLMSDTVIYTPGRTNPAFGADPCRETVFLDLEVLPGIQLFFHNDVPSWPNRSTRSWRDTTIGGRSSQSFLATLDTYIDTHFPEYFDKFPANSQDPQIILQNQELDLFFNNELKDSERKLQDLAEQATKLLCHNVPVTIEINGCVSPLANTPGSRADNNNPYNQWLIKRREHSVQQDLERYGLIKEKWKGLYRFSHVEKKCSKPVTANSVGVEKLQDRVNKTYSVFSIDAAAARRVEVRLRIRREAEN